ncbi:MAG: nucleoside diphosphate kinase regulator [Phycisphaerales bacterium JB065]
MSDRTIYITPQDMDRLRSTIASANLRDRGVDRDRPYLMTLEAELNRAVVIQPEELPPDVITMNSRVQLRDGTKNWVVTLVFPEHADPEDDRISVLAPIGAALLGCRVGQKVSFRVPGGAQRSCDILNVLYQPEAAGDLHL